MNATTIIRQAGADGVTLRLSPAGTLKVAGDQAAVNRWVPVLRAHKPDIIAEMKARPAAVATCWGWRLTLPSGDVVEVFAVPEMTHAEALAFDIRATDAHPIDGANRRPASAPMTADEEQAIRAWLASIGENDPTTTNEVLANCRTNIESRGYFLTRAHDVQVRNPQERSVAEINEQEPGGKVGDAHG